MISWENDCVECADGCHHCGRHRKYPHFYCDDCGKLADKLRYVGKRMVCENCMEDANLDAEEYDEVDVEYA